MNAARGMIGDVCVTDCKKDSIVLQKGETCEYNKTEDIPHLLA